jgi:hypothetical protein
VGWQWHVTAMSAVSVVTLPPDMSPTSVAIPKSLPSLQHQISDRMCASPGSGLLPPCHPLSFSLGSTSRPLLEWGLVCRGTTLLVMHIPAVKIGRVEGLSSVQIIRHVSGGCQMIGFIYSCICDT